MELLTLSTIYNQYFSIKYNKSDITNNNNITNLITNQMRMIVLKIFEEIRLHTVKLSHAVYNCL